MCIGRGCGRIFTGLLAALVLWPAGFAETVHAGQVRLDAGMPLKVRFDGTQRISSGDLKTGDTLQFKLSEPLTVGGVVIIGTDATGIAEVTLAQKAGRPGKPGQLAFEFKELRSAGPYRTIDDRPLALEPSSDSTMVRSGKGKKTLSYILGFGLIIKGGNAEFPVDSVYTPRLVGNVIVKNE